MPPREMTAISAVPPPMSMMRFPDGPPLDARDAGWNADHELGLEDADLATHLVDEVPEHVLGDHVVGNHPVAHRTERRDRARRAAEHEPRLLAYGDDPGPVRAILLRQRDDGWL